MPTLRSALRFHPLSALLWVLLSLAVPCRAATLNVPTTTYPTIQAAVNAAQNGDTVLIADGTYSGDGNRDIDFNGKNITVTSQNGPLNTIIDCQGSSIANHRGFNLHSGETAAVVRSLTIKNGYENNGDSAIYGGGGINNTSGGTISHCIITGNTANSEGGGIYSRGGTINNCTISNNTAGNGGGICNYNGSSGSQVAVISCTLTDNMATASGGGVYDLNDGVGMITVTGCALIGNAAGNGGGIDNLNNGGTVSMTNCTFTGNTASDGNGGGINNSGYNSGTITVTNCLLNGNTAGSTGGGINNLNDHTNGLITVTNCTLNGNTAGAGGGGICNSNNGTFDTGAIVVANCIFTGNTASYEGGGIVNSNGSSGAIMVTNCTLTGNAEVGNMALPGSGGGGVYNSGIVTLTNDILYGDTGGEMAGSGATVTYCDVQGGYAGTGNLNADPLFVSAANGNLHLRPGSPCLGAGTSTGAPAADKDGTTRPNPPSIGAYEVAVSHTRVLWNNPDGKVMLWSVAADGSHTENTFGPYTDGSPSTPWHAAALATGPDGLSHILWTNPDGKVILWTVDDAGSFTYAVYGPYTDGSPSTPWTATALSVGADNLVHILWTNPDHRVILWNVDQSFHFTLAAFGPYDDGSPSTPWNATALATGPDNKTRLLWTNPDGRVILWNVDNSFNFIYHVYGPYTDGSPSTPWGASAVSVGPDNVTHLLWTNPDGRVILWNLDGSGRFTLAAYGPYTDGSPNTPWNATALATGPDGLSHILWTNPDNRVILWGVDSAFNFTLNVYGPYTDGAAQNVWSATALSAGP